MALERKESWATQLAELSSSFGRGATGDADDIVALPRRLCLLAGQTDELVDAFTDQFKIEPIGRLHLERLEMTPVAVEHGELVYSIPLAPLEAVNVSQKEWSVRSEEFEKIVQDVLEDFSEEGVTEKTDLSQSTDSQQRHSTAFTLSGSYSAYGGSVSASYNSSSDDQQAQKDSRLQSRALTQKASSRAKKDHKTSFTVTSVVGSEEQSVRSITNPSTDRAMRIDYFQLVRKWQVDLVRYDLRMTYDITIPGPGIDLLKKLGELHALDVAIDTPFVFSLPLADVNRDHWDELVATWGARIEQPPEQETVIPLHAEFSTPEDDERGLFDPLDFVVPAGYVVDAAFFEAQFGHWDADLHFDVMGHPGGQLIYNQDGVAHRYESDLANLKGRTGDLAVVINHRATSEISVLLTLTLQLTDEAFLKWQTETWNVLREAAEESHLENRQRLIEQRDKLAAEIRAWDALTLRKMEREEIMKSVLRWLLGPDFELVPSHIEDFFEPVAGSAVEPLSEVYPTSQNWEHVIRFGEMIRFLHQAIEWENVIYLMYPYFWDTRKNWEFKRFLKHPDPVHREFLRAGSARVVLTIRPGFETAFAKFVETGELDAEHPYLQIAQEIQNYAKTNYAGIRAANPDEGARPLLTTRQQAAWRSMEQIIGLLERYRATNGSYPTTTQGLGALSSLGTFSATDPWGNEFEYTSPGQFADFELLSLGADGHPGGDGDDADITSWADASLIGRWYEYTPTSSLDISINTVTSELA